MRAMGWSCFLLVATLWASVVAAQEMGPDDPLAGFSQGTAYVRSPDNTLVLFPAGRVQVDGYAFKRDTDKMPLNTVAIRRARLELGGWVGPWIFYNVAGDFAAGPPAAADPVAQSLLNATDDFVGLAPLGNALVWQVGQFDAPFTQENRGTDKYYALLERSNSIRAIIPPQKEVGVMLHGQPYQKLVYYSVGMFNGDGMNFRNVDEHVDVMGRAWVAPLNLFPAVGALQDARVGASLWYARRSGSGLAVKEETTTAGFRYLDTRWTSGTVPTELHQHGDIWAAGVEAYVPLTYTLGFRGESVVKRQFVDASDISATSSGKLTTLGRGTFQTWGTYVEGWLWVVGNSQMLPDPGANMPGRLKAFGPDPYSHGVQVALRAEYLRQRLDLDLKENAGPAAGLTSVISVQASVNYWYSRRARLSAVYGLNLLDGNTGSIAAAIKQNGGRVDEHEVIFRAAVAM